MIDEEHFADNLSGFKNRHRPFKTHPIILRRTKESGIDSQAQMGCHRRQDVTAVERGAHRLTPETRFGEANDVGAAASSLLDPCPASIVRHEQTMIVEFNVEQFPLAAYARLHDQHVDSVR